MTCLLLFSSWGTWYVTGQGLGMVSARNPGFHLICGLVYKEEKQRKQLISFRLFWEAIQALFFWTLRSLDTLRTPPFFILLHWENATVSRCSRGWWSREKMFFSLFTALLSFVNKGCGGSIGIIFLNHFALQIRFLWDTLPALFFLRFLPPLQSVLQIVYIRRV